LRFVAGLYANKGNNPATIPQHTSYDRGGSMFGFTGSSEYRFRIGDYRVIFEVLHDALWVTAIKRRDEAYR
jgi:mRNA-degrading endonuclease RelE of RelBE toxin-antitoxin system